MLGLWLPPAIRPGLHCGEAPLPPGVPILTGLPPAIRPGLHCGMPSGSRSVGFSRASPGHQAGAPLRHKSPALIETLESGLPPAIRPGLHCGAFARSPLVGAGTSFPRPSGRGSIAATTPPALCRTLARLPPAIRPGLHCGDVTGTIWPGKPRTSPGHQAGAPLRRLPGLRRDGGRARFPRPSGRGSIAAKPAVRL